MKTSSYFKWYNIIPLKELGNINHKDGNRYEYVLYNDNYVYQRKNGDLVGWFCSFLVWGKILHKILI